MSFSRKTFTNIFGEINSDFNIYTLEDIASEEKRSIISGPFGSNISSKYFTDSGVPVIRGNNLTEDNTRFIDKGFVFVSHEKADELNTYAKVDDLIFTAAGTIGQVGMIPENSKFNEYVISNKQLRVTLDLDKVNQHYVYYWFSSKLINKYIKQLNTGSTIPLINLSIIKGLPIPLPSKKIQDKIATIILNIDKKIQLNKEINRNLEQLSQNLFKKWFINFDLKNDFNIFESFKESSLGKIPESWEIKTIGDLSEVKGRIGWRGYTTNDLVDEGPWVVGGKEITSGFIDFNSAKHLTREKYEESPEIMLKDKDLIIAKTGTIGPIAMYYDVYGEATLNPNVGLIRSKNIVPALLLTFFKTQRAQYYLNEFTTSSVQPAINQTTIKQLEIALPSDKDLLNTIGSKFEEINLLQFNLNEEIKKLQRLRDTLLPKLMSGEIDVSEINCDMQEISTNNWDNKFTVPLQNNLIKVIS